MKAKTVETSNATGPFTAKIQLRPDFRPTHLSVITVDPDHFHILGSETPENPDKFRTLYFVVNRNSGSQPTLNTMLYYSEDGLEKEKGETSEGDFTFDFDEATGRYKMTFKATVKGSQNLSVEILGSFDLTLKPAK